MFNALLLEKSDAGFAAGVRPVDEAGLPAGDVLVRIEHSTLNIVEGGPHFPNRTHRREVQMVVAQFLERLAPQA